MCGNILLRSLTVIASAGLACCAGSQSHLRILEADNALSVAPAQSAGYDYLVSIRNVKDFGFDPDD